MRNPIVRAAFAAAAALALCAPAAAQSVEDF